MTSIYMPPIARKKRVPGHYQPDSFRVISAHAEETHPTFEPREEKPVILPGPKFVAGGGIVLPDIYNRQTQVLPKAVPDYRANRPHPGGCGFLRNNVRLLNEPICSVYTDATHNEQDLWWPSRTSKEPLAVPPKTKDTVYRKDFWSDDDDRKSAGSTRHSANPNKEPALGTVPVNFLRARDGDQRLYKENISYEHQYDSRIDQNYPRRGKRHGSFVWKQMSPEESRSFVDRQVSELNSEASLPNPLIGEGENMVKFNNGETTSLNTRSPTNLIKEKSPEMGCKSVSFVDDKNDVGVDVRAVQSGLNIANNGPSESPPHTQVVNNNNNNEIPKNINKNSDNQNKPNSKNGNRNGTIQIYNGVETELMESLGLNGQETITA